jgi:hypothetical protein
MGATDERQPDDAGADPKDSGIDGATVRPGCPADVHRRYLRLPHFAATAQCGAGGVSEVPATVAAMMMRDVTVDLTRQSYRWRASVEIGGQAGVNCHWALPDNTKSARNPETGGQNGNAPKFRLFCAALLLFIPSLGGGVVEGRVHDCFKAFLSDTEQRETKPELSAEYVRIVDVARDHAVGEGISPDWKAALDKVGVVDTRFGFPWRSNHRGADSRTILGLQDAGYANIPFDCLSVIWCLGNGGTFFGQQEHSTNVRFSVADILHNYRDMQVNRLGDIGDLQFCSVPLKRRLGYVGTLSRRAGANAGRFRSNQRGLRLLSNRHQRAKRDTRRDDSPSHERPIRPSARGKGLLALTRILGGILGGLLSIPLASGRWRWVRRRCLGWLGYPLIMLSILVLLAPVGW